MKCYSRESNKGLLLAGLLLLMQPQAVGQTEKLEFNRDVRPILSSHCFACHGFDEKKRQADLRLDASEGALADLGGYQAVVPNHPEESVLWQRIVSEDDGVMPPEDFHKPLSLQQKATLRKWIEQGAEYQPHWAFIPPQKPVVPESLNAQNPIDAFLENRLAKEGLGFSEEADNRTLIRRVSLDLTGLPPTPEEVDRFLANPSDDAYTEWVDDLQNRATYGEHMARYWLDLARYADTHGLHLDNERSMWPYRDWVVKAINENVSFADFTRWQLAGDLLPNPTEDQLIASGFNRCNVTTSEGGSINDEWIFRYAVDRTSTAVEVWMGLTAGCAVCHDHKFDPLSTKEFYSMYAFFHSASDPAMDGNIVDTPPILKIVGEQDREKMRELELELTALDAELDGRIAELAYEDPGLMQPPPPATSREEIWFEDAFPSDVQPESSGGPALKLNSEERGPVYSGQFAIQRTSNNEVSQDFFAKGGKFRVPAGGQFFVYCFLEPTDIPAAIMVQFHTDGWKNRAVWGEAEKIPFGKANTTEKVHLGPLPELGKWVRLEMSAKELGLKAGADVTGFALTQFSGTVSWDYFGVTSVVDAAKDPRWSWNAWLKQDYAVIRKALPDDLKRQLQGRTPDQWDPAETEEVRCLWMRDIYEGARDLVAETELLRAPIRSKIEAIQKAAPITFVMGDLPKPRDSFVMLRGQYDNPGEQVTRNVPSFLPPLAPKQDGAYDRLDLADWLLRRDHPLTSRVVVNRFWQQFFGTGLVETSADFGSQGQPPSHPELLDWLAVQFIDDGWDMKQLVKRIVTSRAYRQSSKVTPELLDRDPANRLLARGPRLRLDAEVLRDQALYVSGLLVPTIGGPGVKPYQPPNIWEPVGFGNSNTRYYQQGSGDDLYRRSLYTFLKRTAPPPFMSTFDAPNREQSCTGRQRSNTPMQALQLMNDVQHVEAARAFAQRIILEGGETPKQKINWAWRSVTSRIPNDEEMQIAIELLKRNRRRYGQDQTSAEALVQYGESAVSENLDATELAAYTLLANLILNLDESVSKN